MPIKNADVIYEERDGRVIESKNHESLLKKQEYYYGLVKSQIGQEEEEKNDLLYKKSNLYHSSLKHKSRINYKDM